MAPEPSSSPGNVPGPSNVVVITKIPETITEPQLAASAGRYSEVLQVSFRAADVDGLGWAIVAFATPELAKAARERLDGKPLLGPPSAAQYLVEAKLGEGLYGNIKLLSDQDSPWKEARTPKGEVYYYHATTRQTVWTKPAPDFAPPMMPPPPAGGMLPPSLTPARPGQPGPPASSGARAITPASPATAGALAQTAIQAAVAAAAAQQASNPATASAGPVGANLFIYHMPVSWDDAILRQHFEHFGKILSCRVQKDPDGRPRGFGFVSYDTPTAAQAAIAGMHGFPVEGKHLKVQLKKGDEQQLNPNAVPSLGTSSLSPSVMGMVQNMPGMPPPPGGGLPPPPPGLPPSGGAGATFLPPPRLPMSRPGPY